MNNLSISLVGLVILIHIYIMYLEMFLWATKRGMKAFGLKSLEFAQETKVLASNQGLYNAFLAAGLFWSIISNQLDIALFFLGCVFIAGLYGAFTTKKIRILYIQSIPAGLGLLSILLS